MIEAAHQLATQGLAKPYCLAVHALFAEQSYAELLALSERIVSTDTIPHASNAISVTELLGPG